MVRLMLDYERKFVERGDNDREGVMLQIMTKLNILKKMYLSLCLQFQILTTLMHKVMQKKT